MDAPSIPATSGIYRITCTVTGKFYIGSSINLSKRRRDHFNELQHNAHHNSKLQHAWNKYGEQSFIFEVQEFVLTPFLIEREQYWLDKLKPFGNKGYNIARVAGSCLGIIRSPEFRAKVGAAHLGKKLSDEHKRNVSIAGKDRIMSPKARAMFNARNTTRMKTLIVTSPSGTEYTITGIKPFCREHNLDHSALIGVAKGKCKQHKGWKARYLEVDIT